MNEIAEILKIHAGRYPLMTPRDAVKLIYQNEFGGGHMITDEQSAFEYLKSEYEGLKKDRDLPVSDEIGNGYARFNLCDPQEDPQFIRLLNRIFVLSSKRTDGTTPSFDEKLSVLRNLTADGVFNFTCALLEEYLTAYRSSGYPPVSHSEIYRNAYNPAYRVIDSRYIRLLPAIRGISAQLRQKPNPVICIDGRAASGKSTAAGLLASLFDTEVIHMDDFFLPLPLRTEARYSEPGGNVHYERFEDEVLRGLRSVKPFEYRVFDCGVCDYTDTVTVDPLKPVIIEGAYCTRPGFGGFGDLYIFSDISPALQRERIRERNGEEMLARFEELWIPMEEKYFDVYDIAAKCDVVIG